MNRKEINDMAILAMSLYNAGYRRIPDGAVILTSQQRETEIEAANRVLAEMDELKTKIEWWEKVVSGYKAVLCETTQRKDEAAECIDKLIKELKKEN